MISVYAPGRAELLGNHTDYNEGYVLAIAVNRGTTLRGEARRDDAIILHADDLPDRFETRLADLAPSATAPWANYVLGVASHLQRRGCRLGGFECHISSNLPIGAGLSSSAALEVSTALFLREAFGLMLTNLEMAQAGQQAEHEYVGVKCGLLDQISSLFSEEGHVTFIDCRGYEVRAVAAPAEGSFVVANTGVKHALVAGEYNERRADCEAAAHALGVPFLRDATRKLFVANRASLPARAAQRALHILGENERVLEGVKALNDGDCVRFGRLMYESHASSQNHFANSCPELDVLVAAAREFPDCFGARLSGGGFGGATINYVRAGREEAFAEHLNAAYPDATFLFTPASGGAGTLKA